MINGGQGREGCTVEGEGRDADEFSPQSFSRDFRGVDQAAGTNTHHGIGSTGISAAKA